MPLDEPSWWYDVRNAWPAIVLRPFSQIYGAVAARRLRDGPKYRSKLPVICIGNFTAGGTGKTPLAVMLGDRLRRSGETPVVLSRGYGGSLRGPHLVDPKSSSAAQTGDEPLLLAQHQTTVIARDRVLGARFIEQRQLGTVIIMDDGLQNPKLAKTLSIAVVDGARGFGNGHVIPSGPLRAPLYEQLGLVGAIVLIGGGRQSLPAGLEGASCPVMRAAPEPVGDLGWLRAQRLVAFAGIGHPERFFALLRDGGGELVETIAFADHHPFSQDDAERLLTRARVHAAALVTTEKDFARLAGHTGHAATLAAATRVLKIRLAFEERHDNRLLDLVGAAVARHRDRADKARSDG